MNSTSLIMRSKAPQVNAHGYFPGNRTTGADSTGIGLAQLLGFAAFLAMLLSFGLLALSAISRGEI